MMLDNYVNKKNFLPSAKDLQIYQLLPEPF